MQINDDRYAYGRSTRAFRHSVRPRRIENNARSARVRLPRDDTNDSREKKNDEIIVLRKKKKTYLAVTIIRVCL